MTQSAADPNLAATVRFILEMDRLKSVYRQSPLLDGTRRENSAEHSWHMAVMAMILADYADQPVNVARVVELLLLHDIVEIDAGDVFLYDDKGSDNKHDNEQQAANRLFGMLPAHLGERLKAAWLEFETGDTPEARFARGLDRFQPLLINFYSGGGTWKHPQVHYDKVVAKKSVIGQGSTLLWQHGKALLDEAVRQGILRTAPAAVSSDIAQPSPFLRQASEQADNALRDKLRAMEDAYDIKLPTVISFEHDELHELHHQPFDGDASQSRVEIASWGVARIPQQIRQLGNLARQPSHAAEDRSVYKAILLDIYRALPVDVMALVSASDTLVVAPRREGYLLADSLGWLPDGRYLAPHAKRFKHAGGMVVGCDLIPPTSAYRRCVMVDGAMASGVSLMAMMIELAPTVQEFIVLTVHTTGVAINALRHMAARLQRPLTIYAGDVSGDLSDKFYAVLPETTPPQVVVGDLGDMIAGPVTVFA
ncbi:HD domain-containing protein [Chitinivorax sp. B]|uniref:HD domain-containing protein n=1 Tax=Chitinivorax sp. B TaxID=2502235 RepID=UPI002016B756|nr:HD domain-containing protein [Chitinivorax sp. B]